MPDPYSRLFRIRTVTVLKEAAIFGFHFHYQHTDGIAGWQKQSDDLKCKP
jgi:hypothetical protein